jgi:ATP-dependent DNA helicase RecG
MIRRRFAAMPEEDVLAYLTNGQNDHVAFLPANVKHESIAETLAAMANANGGLLFLGVTAKGAPQKNANLDALREAVVEAGLLTDPPLILPTPHCAACSAGEVVVVQVPPGLPHLYNLGGRYITRTAGQNRPLTTGELRRLLLERGDSGYESQPAPEATLNELDQQQIERYLNRIAVAPADDPVTVLAARGCLSKQFGADWTPTVAGVLLFGQEPQRFFRNAEIICVRYAGVAMSDEFVRQDIGGTLAEQIRLAEAFVVTNMQREMRIVGMQREETTAYPLPVVREAIVNAIAHRDYSIRGEGIRLLIFSDRLEIYSPGRLPGHVTLENLKDERYSRNEAIVAVLSDLGYIERLGYGIDRMIATMAEAGLPEPIFEETTAGFRVILYAASEETPPPPVAPPVAQQFPLGHFNERQERVLAYLATNGRITNSDYQAFTPDVSAETIRRDLADLVEKNLLIRIGSKRATYYILK